MDLKEKLINILEKYIDEYKKLKEEYRQKRTIETLYKELISFLNEHQDDNNKIYISILLNTIYGNNIYVDQFYQILYSKNYDTEIKQFLAKLLNDYNNLKRETEELKMRINRSQYLVSSASRVIISLKYGTQILESKNDIFNVKKIISYYETAGLISNKEELLLINEIELYNRMVLSKFGVKEQQEYTENLYSELPNILTTGFQEHDVIDVSEDKKKTLNNFAKEIINLIPYSEMDELIKTIENYKKYNIDDNEYNYIIVKLLDYYLDEILTTYELLMDREVYTKRTQRIEIIKNYYLLLEIYISIRDYYNKINEYTPASKDTEEEANIEISKTKRLIYSRSEVNISKTKIISDMSNIPYEYYDTVTELLNGFKNGTLNKKEIKALCSSKEFNGYLELRHDQVRIVFKHVKDDIYAILGVFAKKANNDLTMYKRIISRRIPNVDTEEKLATQLTLSEITEEELAKLVKEKGRANNR